MVSFRLALLLGAAVSAVSAQYEIDELFSTNWNYTKVVEYSNPKIKFVPGVPLTQSVNSTATTPDLVGLKVLDHQVHQVVDKIGAGVTDASSIVLQAFKAAHPEEYWDLLRLLFSQDPEWINRGGAGLNAVRSPLGASDFGLQPYSFDDTADGSTDPDFKLFTIDKAPKLWQTLIDIKKINPNVRNYFAPWSPPGWMKDNNGPQPLFGGHLKEGNEELLAKYLAKSLIAIRDEHGIEAYSLSVQNEPYYTGSQYSTSGATAEQLAKVGDTVRGLLNKAGMTKVKLVAYDHNWDHLDRALRIFDNSKEDTWDGICWHCYAGDPRVQQVFNNAYPNKSVHFCECTSIMQFRSEPYANFKEKSTKVLFNSVRYKSEAVILWNIALQTDEDGFTTPHLPNVCTNCAAPIVFNPGATNGNATALLADATGTKLRTLEAAQADQLATQQQSVHTANQRRMVTMRPRGTDEEAMLKAEKVAKVTSIKADQTKPKPPNQADKQETQYFRKTSDYVLLSHLSLAVRPRVKGGAYGRVIGFDSTEVPYSDDQNSPTNPVAGRVLAQFFRSDNIDPSKPELSRFSLVLLNQNDHYETGVFEDLTVTIWFRGSVANFTSGPGLYTLSWLANKTSDITA
ncbi:hypothetical protein ACQY0O_002228 [Thecaphora frezii]